MTRDCADSLHLWLLVDKRHSPQLPSLWCGCNKRDLLEALLVYELRYTPLTSLYVVWKYGGEGADDVV